MAVSLTVRSIALFFLPIGLATVLLSAGYIAISLQSQTKSDTSVSTSPPTSTPQPESTQSANVLGATEANITVPETPTISTEKLFLLVNAHRVEHSLPKVTLHPKLLASAQLKLNDMLEKKYYQHQDENQQTTWEFFQLAGYHYALAGENLAFNIGSEWDIFTAWKESEQHNREMLNPLYTDVGFAADCKSIKLPNYKCIVVAHFGKQ